MFPGAWSWLLRILTYSLSPRLRAGSTPKGGGGRGILSAVRGKQAPVEGLGADELALVHSKELSPPRDHG